MAGDAHPTVPHRKHLAEYAAAYARRSARIKVIMGSAVVLVDALMLIGAFMLAYWGRTNLPFFPVPDVLPRFVQYIPTLILHVSVIITMYFFSRLYHQRRATSRIDQARTITGAVTIGAVISSGLQELLLKGSALEVDYPRSMFFYAWFFSVVFAVAGREAVGSVRARLRRRGVDRDNLLIVGTGKVARDITGKIKSHPELGYRIVGIVNGNSKGKVHGIRIIGTYHDLPTLIDTFNVQQVIIALPDAKRSELVDLITLCQRGRVDIKIYPDMFAYMAGDLNVDELGGIPLLTVRDIALRGWRLSLKRGMDFFGALFGLIFLSPLMLLTALLIRLESKGPIFYTQVRMGLDGRPFPMIKFRSMYQDAEASGPGWTVPGDARVTRIGKFLRRTSWDEIPQLINVLLGQMSLVGPRPERSIYVQQFREQIPRYMERHREKAGMTGWAQVNGLRGDTSITQRTAYDLWYVENWSLWLDFKIIIRTILQIILRREKNAY